mmetsp:Transcript_14204/g.22913  ORF Transcript_14204/g.22913 Transcript_14204/m.22913 type:complete len:286 (+) Transcript_14204:95-952(+)
MMETKCSNQASVKSTCSSRKRNDSLSAVSEHVSTSSSGSKTKQLVVRRVASYGPNHKRTVIKVGQEQRSRRVTFAKGSQIVGHVPLRSELSEDEFESVWYTKDDFKAMKKDFIPVVKKMAKKLPLDEGEEPRGLEHKTPRGSKSRQQNRYQAMDAVLEEQERQWDMDRRDATYIAQIYRQSSAHCQMNAYLVAQKDAEFVEREQQKEQEGGVEEGSEGSLETVEIPLSPKGGTSCSTNTTKETDTPSSRRTSQPQQQEQQQQAAQSTCIIPSREVLSPQLLVSAL